MRDVGRDQVAVSSRSSRPSRAAKALASASPPVYGIVMPRVAGEIVVESDPGQGAAFTVYLPAETGPAQVRRRRPSLNALGSATVLLSRMSRLSGAGSDHSRAGGLLGVEAANAEEAETLFEAMRASICWSTDVVMPADPASSCPSLQAKLPSLRGLFISGYTTIAMFDETIVERDLAFLEKPFSAEGLVAKVRDVLAGSR